MKTAMQELLDWVKEFEDKLVKPTLTNVKEKIWQLLPNEREQITEAFNKGYDDHEYNNTEIKFGADPDVYYTQTYNNETTT